MLLYGPVSLVAGWLPRRMGYALVKPLCTLAFRHRHKTRRILAENLRIALAAQGNPPSESVLNQILQRNFMNFGKFVVDFFRLGRLSPDSLERIVTLENGEYLRQCIDMGAGIVGVTAHLGNWELGANVLRAQGCSVTAIVRTQPSPRLDALFQGRRIRRGTSVLPMAGAASAGLAGLRRRDCVILLADLDYSQRAPRALLFGKPARLPRGPAILAARGKAPVLPGFVIRQPDDTFQCRLYPPILPRPALSADDIQSQISAILEEVITQYPDQWFAYEPMWSHGPALHVDD